MINAEGTLAGREGIELRDTLERVRDEVEAETRKSRVVPQVPQAMGFPLEGRHYFRPARSSQ